VATLLEMPPANQPWLDVTGPPAPLEWNAQHTPALGVGAAAVRTRILVGTRSSGLRAATAAGILVGLLRTGNIELPGVAS
jgi:hypothetical protein